MGQGTDVVGNRGQRSRGWRDADNLARQNAGDATDADATPETAAIRGDIERTRAEMAQTIDQLQERLDPQVVTKQVKERVRNEAQDRVTRAAQTMRTGVIQRVQRVQAKVSDTAASLSQGTGTSTSGGLSGTLSQWGTLARRQAQRAIGRMRLLADEDPGAYTALLVVAGIGVVGLAWIIRSADD